MKDEKDADTTITKTILDIELIKALSSKIGYNNNLMLHIGMIEGYNYQAVKSGDVVPIRRADKIYMLHSYILQYFSIVSSLGMDVLNYSVEYNKYYETYALTTDTDSLINYIMMTMYSHANDNYVKKSRAVTSALTYVLTLDTYTCKNVPIVNDEDEITDETIMVSTDLPENINSENTPAGSFEGFDFQ